MQWFKRAQAQVNPAVPVVAVGSLSLGGTGKTPMVIALAQRLAGFGRNVHVVTRGDGAPMKVREREHSAADVGDEPLLIAAFVPTWIAADPVEGVRAAAEDGADVVVLDGGLPDGPVTPVFRVLVEDAVKGFGNGRARPFGPLKVPLNRGLAGADLLVTVGPRAAQASFAQSASLSIPHVAAHLAPLQTGMSWEGMRVYAFAGIGVPERFFASLHDVGADLIAKHPLTDHQELTPALLLRMEREAWALQAQMVTTEKDAVRLPPEVRRKVLVLPVRLEPESWAPFDARLGSL